MESTSSQRLTGLGWLLILGVIAGSAYGAWRLLRPALSGQRSPEAAAAGPAAAPAAAAPPGAAVRLGIAYGTEKRRWLEWAVEQFGRSDEGKGIVVDLIPLGSIEAAQAILAGDRRIHVWSPASAVYATVLAEEWKLKNGGDIFVRSEPLALTPMVFVMWDERYQAFARKYPALTFRTIGQALGEKGGWASIAGKPEWGLFKFGHTHPNQSNSGLITLVLMAYDFRGTCRGLELADILDVGYQEWMSGIERGVSGMSNSTGNLMRDMVLKGPSVYDAVFVYENVAIDYLRNAEGRWGRIRVVYPEVNLWNDSPYYILATPWVGEGERRAAEVFLRFLLGRAAQEQSLVHGFRPADPAVPIKTAQSPFTELAPFGLRVEVSSACDPPRGEVINNLLASWQRSQGPR